MTLIANSKKKELFKFKTKNYNEYSWNVENAAIEEGIIVLNLSLYYNYRDKIKSTRLFSA